MSVEDDSRCSDNSDIIRIILPNISTIQAPNNNLSLLLLPLLAKQSLQKTNSARVTYYLRIFGRGSWSALTVQKAPDGTGTLTFSNLHKSSQDNNIHTWIDSYVSLVPHTMVWYPVCYGVSLVAYMFPRARNKVAIPRF